jgi:hypothetical protein
MITAEKLNLLTNMPADILTLGIQQAGYKKDTFTSAKFLGLTNNYLFCYLVVYPTEDGAASCKVFVNYDPTADLATVDY